MAINATSGANLPYNLTDVIGATNVLEFVQNVNDMVGGIFMLGILLAAFVILFVSMRGAGNEEALTATTFIITILAFGFYGLGFIDGLYLTAFIVAFGFLFIYKVLKPN